MFQMCECGHVQAQHSNYDDSCYECDCDGFRYPEEVKT